MPTKKRVIHCVSDGTLPGEQEIFQPLLDAGLDVVFNHLHSIHNEQTVIDAVVGYEYVIAGTEFWTRNVFEAAKASIKMLVRHGVGMDNVDMDAARELGVAVSNTPGANAAAVAEHALAMLLALIRKVSKYDRDIRNGIWKRELSRSLSGKVGLIGFGAVAQSFAKLLGPFPVEIMAYDIFFNEKAAQELGVAYATLDEILAECEVVSLHVPTTPETDRMVNDAFIRKMRTDAIIINTSRGTVVDEPALIAALQENRIAGAALDVFEHEPVEQDSPLIKMDNTIVTPHAANMNIDALRNVAAQCVANILDYEQGCELRYIVK
ncbi:MAG: NAD(P)-binding domain-containing protein [Oscillospiraceae bacterium]|nr:NAD(P)-binding domain-containing protein [Oscillospiraceae bacterium]